jgi:hypothetical protein
MGHQIASSLEIQSIALKSEISSGSTSCAPPHSLQVCSIPHIVTFVPFRRKNINATLEFNSQFISLS